MVGTLAMEDELSNLNAAFKYYKKIKETRVTLETLDAAPSASLPIKSPLLELPMLAVNNSMAEAYAEQWLEFFFTDREGKDINSRARMENFNHTFTSKPHTIVGQFTFDMTHQFEGQGGPFDSIAAHLAFGSVDSLAGHLKSQCF